LTSNNRHRYFTPHQWTTNQSSHSLAYKHFQDFPEPPKCFSGTLS